MCIKSLVVLGDIIVLGYLSLMYLLLENDHSDETCHMDTVNIYL